MRVPISRFFRLDRVHNHSSDCRALRSIEPGNEEKRCRSHLGNGTESLKIRIGNHTRDLPGKETEHTQFRIN